MAGALGENYLVQIGNGASPTTFANVACQGDLTVATGKTLEVSRTKNCKHPFFRDAGYTAQFTIELESPMHATHTSILDAAEDREPVPIRINSSDTGLPIWTGEAYVTFDPLTAPTEGPATLAVSVAFLNDPVRTAAA